MKLHQGTPSDWIPCNDEIQRKTKNATSEGYDQNRNRYILLYEKPVFTGKHPGLTECDLHYSTEHISVDVTHTDNWLNNPILLIVKKMEITWEI